MPETMTTEEREQYAAEYAAWAADHEDGPPSRDEHAAVERLWNTRVRVLIDLYERSARRKAG